ncbi:hypothetical protein [Methylobacterium sp. CM6246]
MAQTLTGWILITAVVLAGAGSGYSAARIVTTVRDGREIELRDVVMAAIFGVLLITSGLLLLTAEGT